MKKTPTKKTPPKRAVTTPAVNKVDVSKPRMYLHDRHAEALKGLPVGSPVQMVVKARVTGQSMHKEVGGKTSRSCDLEIQKMTPQTHGKMGKKDGMPH